MHIFIYIHIAANIHPFISNSFLYQSVFLNCILLNLITRDIVIRLGSSCLDCCFYLLPVEFGSPTVV